jgi:hypothetical protein
MTNVGKWLAKGSRNDRRRHVFEEVNRCRPLRLTRSNVRSSACNHDER